jgi:hypothetical protein
MFRKHTLSLNRVYDTVTIREGGKTLTLHVNADANRLVVGLAQAQKRLMTIDENTPDDEREEISRFFSDTIFGAEQTQELFDYYYGDASCVIAICGTYFSERLSKLISKAQRKIKTK